MKFKILFQFIFIFVFLSCSKKEETIGNVWLNLEEFLDLKNYEISKRKINDTVSFYTGKKGYLTIEGKYNLKQNKKFGWWKIYDSKTKDSIKIEMLIEESENTRNQILCFSKGQLVSPLSKFYKNEIKDHQISYIFNVPKDTLKNKKNFFSYLVIGNNQELRRKTLSISKNPESNIYEYKINLEEFSKVKPIFVTGIFTESTYNFEKNAAENWEILTLDSLK